jgi:hypothetical protein
MSEHEHSGHPDDGYDGPAHLVTESGDVPVQVTVRGLFQPIDGHYHWHGRIARDERVDALGRAGATVVLRTPGGEAEGRLSDVDPWGRYRITGVGRPPYPCTESDPR